MLLQTGTPASPALLFTQFINISWRRLLNLTRTRMGGITPEYVCAHRHTLNQREVAKEKPWQTILQQRSLSRLEGATIVSSQSHSDRGTISRELCPDLHGDNACCSRLDFPARFNWLGLSQLSLNTKTWQNTEGGCTLLSPWHPPERSILIAFQNAHLPRQNVHMESGYDCVSIDSLF